jgi:formate dehydrogenase major subunit
VSGIIEIKYGEMVCVVSRHGKVDIKAFVTDGVKPGVLSSTFHFPEIRVNDLTSSLSDSEAMCPEYKVVSVRVRRSLGKSLV